MMIGFAIQRNGEHVCTLGVRDGVTSVIFSCVTSAHGPTLEAGGLEAGEHLDWARLDLQPGDEVTVRVVEGEHADEPVARYRDDPALLRKAKQEAIERYRAEFDEEGDM